MKNHWILTGSLVNWDVAISNSLWGVRDKLKSSWGRLVVGDILFFYVTRPISGIIGIGKVTNKFIGKNQIWADEVENNEIIYPYRFEFQTLYVSQKPWKERKISLGGLKTGFWAGINPIVNDEVIEVLNDRMKRFWKYNLESPEEEIEKKGEIKLDKGLSLHDDIKNKIKEIGIMKNFISEVEYQIGDHDKRFLDVVWRTPGVVGGVPKYIFEVEDKGGLYRALAKLKHCFDIWGFPKLFIVVKNEDVPKIDQLLSGTFHEIKENLKILNMERINQLYDAEKKSFDAKQGMGLP